MTTHLLHKRLLRATARRSPRPLLLALCVLFATALVTLVWLQREQLQRVSFTTGYALFAAVVALISLHWRKQAPSLPLGKVSTWLQMHLYLGYFTILLFGLHVGFRIPTGIFETALFAIFSIVAGSGVYGLYITRTIPQQLRRLPEEVIYERIPARRNQLAHEARRLLLSDVRESSVLIDFYRSTLVTFFEQPRELRYLLRPNSQRRRYLLAQLHELHRFLDTNQRAKCDALAELVCRKDDLDFHAALQGRLKLWMYVHIAFSYSLLMLGAVHGVVAHAFRGGAQ